MKQLGHVGAAWINTHAEWVTRPRAYPRRLLVWVGWRLGAQWVRLATNVNEWGSGLTEGVRAGDGGSGYLGPLHLSRGTKRWSRRRRRQNRNEKVWWGWRKQRVTRYEWQNNDNNNKPKRCFYFITKEHECRSIRMWGIINRLRVKVCKCLISK